MGLFYRKSVLDPAGPMSDGLPYQGDPFENWSQSRSATPHSLSQSYGGSGQCSFTSGNREGGIPEFLFGADLSLYGAWQQDGKVTGVDTDGDISSYVVDDIVARFNREVKVAPLTVGWQSKIFWSPDVNDRGEFDPATRSLQARVGPDGDIWQGLWRTGVGGVTKQSGALPSENWPSPESTEFEWFAVSDNPDISYCAGQLENYSKYIDWFTKEGQYLGWTDVSSYYPPSPRISDMVMGWDGSVYLSFDEETVLVRCKPTVSGGSVSTVTTTLTFENSDFPLGAQFPDDSAWGMRMHVIPKKEDDGLFLVRTIRVNSSRGRWGVSVCETDPLGNSSPYRSHLRTAEGLTDAQISIIREPWIDLGAAMDSHGNFIVYWDGFGRRFIWNPAVDLIPRILPEGITGGDSRKVLAALWGGALVLHPDLDGLAVFTIREPIEGQEYYRYGYYFEVISEPTLAQAYFLYMLEAGIEFDFRPGPGLGGKVAYPAWEGNLLDHLTEMAAITRTEFGPGVLPGQVRVDRLASGSSGHLPDTVGGKPSLSLGTDGAVEQYSMQSQNAEHGTNTVVYDAASYGNTITIKPREIIRTSFTVPHSLVTVTSPSWRDGDFVVTDVNGWDMTSQFGSDGGGVTATVNSDDPSIIDVVIYGGAGSGWTFYGNPNEEIFADMSNQEYTFAEGAIPALRIRGSGVLQDPENVTIWTGVDPELSSGSRGPNYQSPFLQNKDAVFTASNAINMEIATPSISISGVSTVRDAETGRKYRYNDAMYRVMSTDAGDLGGTHDLAPATSVGDHDDVWAASFVSDHDDFWDGNRVMDIRLRPLWSDWPLLTDTTEVFVRIDTDGAPFWDFRGDPDASVLEDTDGAFYYSVPYTEASLPLRLDDDLTPYVLEV